MQNKPQHSNLTRALGDSWAVSLCWGNLVVWRSFGLSGQIVCATTFAKEMKLLLIFVVMLATIAPLLANESVTPVDPYQSKFRRCEWVRIDYLNVHLQNKWDFYDRLEPYLDSASVPYARKLQRENPRSSKEVVAAIRCHGYCYEGKQARSLLGLILRRKRGECSQFLFRLLDSGDGRFAIEILGRFGDHEDRSKALSNYQGSKQGQAMGEDIRNRIRTVFEFQSGGSK